MSFKDHFSTRSDNYRQYRPGYPDDLFDYLASKAPALDLCWDCATGSGQAAVQLARHFNQVVASDASEQQIANNMPVENIDYRVASAENSGLEDGSVDLITVAQALHWFDIDRFIEEAQRILKPKGVLAIWSYKLLSIDPEIDKIVNNLYGKTLDAYWPAERKMVETAYADIKFSFKTETVSDFTMEAEWNLRQLLGYLGTWSATKRFIKSENFDPVEKIAQNLNNHWGDATHIRTVRWPLNLILAHPNI